MKKGIDVSYCQAGMDFQAAADAGTKFCIVRIGRRGDSGTLYLDTDFVDNINGALAAGMEVGVYFYTKAVDVQMAAEDAAWLTAALEQYCLGTELTAGIWYDVEDGDTTGTCDAETITAICSRWVCEMNEAGYNNAGIYSSYDWLTNKIGVSELADYVPIWPANYGGSTNWFAKENPGKYVPVWQYADNVTDDVNGARDPAIYYDGDVMIEGDESVANYIPE